MKRLDETGAVQLSRRLQLSLIILVMSTWLCGAITPFVLAWRNGDTVASGYMWFTLWAQFLLPLVYLAIGLVYATQHYRERLHQLFVAIFLAVLGMLLYMAAQSLLTVYRFGIAAPQTYLQQPTFWQQYGVDAVITIGSLLLYTILVWHHDWRLYHKK